ncbi:MFS transporter [Streptosporangium sp. DT93]|uniref:MFS transporter n=1 Tax=Streptosporangium sp. DT93 TaxID=3393428 RepID=UPI003CF93C32
MSGDRLAHHAWRYRWVVLAVATFTQAASGFFVQGIAAMSAHLQHDLNIGTTQLGLLLSAAQLLPLVGLPVAGGLLDRHDERWVVGAGATVVALSLAAGSTAPGYTFLLVVLLIAGAGYSTVQPGGSKSVASWFHTSRRGLAMGVRQAGLPLGGVLAAATLPGLATALGLRATLMTGALVALAGALAFMCLYRRPPAQGPFPGPAPAGPASAGTTPVGPAPAGPASAGTESRLPLTSRFGARLRTLREPPMARIVLSGTAMVSVHSGIGVLTVLHLREVTSLGAGPTALVFVAVQTAGAAGRVCLAAWSDRGRPGRHTCVLICMIAATAGMIALTTPLGHSPATACPLFVWLGFFGIGWYGPWVTHAAESAPPGRTGTTLGLAMAVNQIAIIVAPPALGLLKDLTGSFVPAWGLLSVMTATTLTITARRP